MTLFEIDKDVLHNYLHVHIVKSTCSAVTVRGLVVLV